MEIFWSGSWGAISDSTWTDDDANVVCKQLQHSSSYYGKSKLFQPCMTLYSLFVCVCVSVCVCVFVFLY